MKNISPILQDNINMLNELLPLSKSFDLITHRMELCHLDSYFIGMNGYFDNRVLQTIFKSLQRMDYSTLQKESDSNICLIEKLTCSFPVGQIQHYQEFEPLLKNLLSGTILLFFEGINEGFSIDIRQYPVRSIEEPENEKVIRGSKDGFVETLLFNANLIRRRIRSTSLTFEVFSVGSQSKTDVSLAYLDGKADPELLDEIKKRLGEINVSALTMGTKSMEELLVPHKWYHPLPSMFRTERPDVACSYLLEGYILLMVDTTPSVLILPSSIFQFSQSPEDYYKSPLMGNYIRLFRFLCGLVSLLLMPLFLLLAAHPELLPNGVSLLPTGDLSPVRLFVYVLFAELALDLFKYSSSHNASGFSGSFGIIGGLLIGDVAIKLQWASSEIIFYAAATMLASLSLNSVEYSDAIRMYRMFLLLSTGFFGLPGFLAGCGLVLLSVFTTPAAFGRSYFWPLFPFNWKALRTLLFRFPIRYKQPPQIWHQKK